MPLEKLKTSAMTALGRCPKSHPSEIVDEFRACRPSPSAAEIAKLIEAVNAAVIDEEQLEAEKINYCVNCGIVIPPSDCSDCICSYCLNACKSCGRQKEPSQWRWSDRCVSCEDQAWKEAELAGFYK